MDAGRSGANPSKRVVIAAVIAGVLAAGAAAAIVVPSCLHETRAEPETPLSAAGTGAEPARAEPAVRWQPEVRVASGPAHRGPWRMNESEFHYVDDPTVALTQSGVVVVAWVDQSRQDVSLQVYEPDGQERFAEPVDVSRTPEVFSWLPRLVVGSEDAGEIHVLWQEIVFSGGTHGGEIFFARSTDGGRSFEPPLDLSSTTNGAGKGRLTEERWDNGSLDLARGADGVLYAAWTEYQGPLRFARSDDRGESFSEPVRVAGGEGEPPARGPSIAVGAEGAVYLAWTVGEDDEADIHLAASSDGGRSFAPRGVVHDSDGHSDAPKIAVDGRGTLHAVWAESPEGMFRRYHVRYARSEDGGARFEPPRRLPAPDDGDFESMSFPHLSLDGEGDVHLLWELHPEPRHRPRALAFTRSTDRGERFARPTVVPGTLAPDRGFNGSQQGLLMRKLDVNDAGALAVVNSTFARGRASHVWLVRGESGS